MTTTSLHFRVHNCYETNSTWITWDIQRLGIRDEELFDEKLDSGQVECLWSDHHDLSIRCAAQKAVESYLQHSGVLDRL